MAMCIEFKIQHLMQNDCWYWGIQHTILNGERWNNLAIKVTLTLVIHDNFQNYKLVLYAYINMAISTKIMGANHDNQLSFRNKKHLGASKCF
jgi:oligoribonuclease NrnB/cAMP/cGMP phosphodiesterase (DHH superfamily)